MQSGGYDRYHLLSGQDLPIKKISEIEAFFENSKTAEFVDIGNGGKPIKSSDPGGVFSFYNRIALYHYGIKGWRKNKFLKGIEYASILLQRCLKIDRINNIKEDIYCGANWFSITNECARYVVSQEKHIEKLYSKHTRCTDELFLQTELMNSDFRNRLVGRNFRLVDFTRGKPYTWHKSDLRELLNSDCLFARKFDESIDDEVIKELYKRLINTGDEENEEANVVNPK